MLDSPAYLRIGIAEKTAVALSVSRHRATVVAGAVDMNGSGDAFRPAIYQHDCEAPMR